MLDQAPPSQRQRNAATDLKSHHQIQSRNKVLGLGLRHVDLGDTVQPVASPPCAPPWSGPSYIPAFLQ